MQKSCRKRPEQEIRLRVCCCLNLCFVKNHLASWSFGSCPYCSEHWAAWMRQPGAHTVQPPASPRAQDTRGGCCGRDLWVISAPSCLLLQGKPSEGTVAKLLPKLLVCFTNLSSSLYHLSSLWQKSVVQTYLLGHDQLLSPSPRMKLSPARIQNHFHSHKVTNGVKTLILPSKETRGRC